MVTSRNTGLSFAGVGVADNGRHMEAVSYGPGSLDAREASI